MTGSQRLMAALSDLFTNHFHAREKITPKHMIMGVGVSAIMDQLVSKLCDEDDGILIAAPYYSKSCAPCLCVDMLMFPADGFDNDLSARSLVKPIGVDLGDADPASPESLQHLETYLANHQKTREGPIRAVILCNPNNPQGTLARSSYSVSKSLNVRM